MQARNDGCDCQAGWEGNSQPFLLTTLVLRLLAVWTSIWIFSLGLRPFIQFGEPELK